MAKKKKAQGRARQKDNRPSKKQTPPPGRLGPHRPLFERILFILALAGVLVASHLNIWYGTEVVLSDDPVCGVGFDCLAVLANDPMPLGLPSAVWGLLFYLTVAGVCAGILFITDEKRLLLKKVRVGLIGSGLVYSLYLTGYQFFVLPDRCLLCLISASIVTLMAVVLAVYVFKPAPSRSRGGAPALQSEYQLYGILAVLLLLLAGADFVYFNSLDLPAAGTAEAIPLAADLPVDVSQCRFDTEKPYYSNFNRLVADDDPIKGNPDSPVTLIEFLDPNCPHCKTLLPAMKRVAYKYADQVRFVYKPIALLGGSVSHSLEEVAALYLANEAGQFSEMLDLQFINQNRAGLSVSQLSGFARQLGLDARQFTQDLTSGRLTNRIRRQRQVFLDLRLTGVPTVMLEGRVIDTGSRSVGCLSHFIEQELRAKGLLEEPEAEVEETGASSEEGS